MLLHRNVVLPNSVLYSMRCSDSSILIIPQICTDGKQGFFTPASHQVYNSISPEQFSCIHRFPIMVLFCPYFVALVKRLSSSLLPSFHSGKRGCGSTLLQPIPTSLTQLPCSFDVVEAVRNRGVGFIFCFFSTESALLSASFVCVSGIILFLLLPHRVILQFDLP